MVVVVEVRGGNGGGWRGGGGGDGCGGGGGGVNTSQNEVRITNILVTKQGNSPIGNISIESEGASDPQRKERVTLSRGRYANTTITQPYCGGMPDGLCSRRGQDSHCDPPAL